MNLNNGIRRATGCEHLSFAHMMLMRDRQYLCLTPFMANNGSMYYGREKTLFYLLLSLWMPRLIVANLLLFAVDKNLLEQAM